MFSGILHSVPPKLRGLGDFGKWAGSEDWHELKFQG